jgi:hypothetical protein
VNTLAAMCVVPLVFLAYLCVGESFEHMKKTLKKEHSTLKKERTE